MEREAEVMRWHAELPKKERLAWNHPTSIWRHFDKWQKKTAAKESTSLTTGLAAAEEAEVVEDAQVRAAPRRQDRQPARDRPRATCHNRQAQCRRGQVADDDQLPA